MRRGEMAVAGWALGLGVVAHPQHDSWAVCLSILVCNQTGMAPIELVWLAGGKDS